MVRLQKMETDFVRRIQKFYRGHMARVASRRHVKLPTYRTVFTHTLYRYTIHPIDSSYRLTPPLNPSFHPTSHPHLSSQPLNLAHPLTPPHRPWSPTQMGVKTRRNDRCAQPGLLYGSLHPTLLPGASGERPGAPKARSVRPFHRSHARVRKPRSGRIFQRDAGHELCVSSTQRKGRAPDGLPGTAQDGGSIESRNGSSGKGGGGKTKRACGQVASRKRGFREPLYYVLLLSILCLHSFSPSLVPYLIFPYLSYYPTYFLSPNISLSISSPTPFLH